MAEQPLVPPTLPLRWVCERFENLGVQALHDALALRCRVFILEQGAYQDPDGADARATHVLGYGARPHAPLAACLRVVDPGARYAEPSIGRVVVAPEARGLGLGRALMRKGLACCEAAWPGQAVRISAQAHLVIFYSALGFEAVGAPYLEDDIPHQEMLRPAGHKELA